MLRGLILLTLFLASQCDVERGVMDITDDNYKRIINGFSHVLINVCNNPLICNQLTTVLNSIYLKLRGSGIVFGKLNVENSSKYLEHYKIGKESQHALMFFSNKMPYTYKDALDASGIHSWIINLMKYRYKNLTSVDDISKISLERPAIVFLTSDAKEIRTSYETITKISGDYAFYALVVAQPPSIYNVTKLPALLLLKDYDDRINVHEGKMETSAVMFIEEHVVPVLGKFNEAYKKIVYKGLRSLVLLFFKDMNEETYKFLYQMALEKIKGFSFMLVDYSDPSHAAQAEKLGWSAERGNAIFIIQDRGRSYYKLESEITQENIKQFITGYIDRKLPKYYRSEDIPMTNLGPVIKAVGKTYNTIAMNTSNDVIILHVNEKCEKCSEAEELLLKVAHKLTPKYPSLVFAKIDMSVNAVENLTNFDYPEIQGYSKASKSRKMFKGLFTEEELTEFVEYGILKIHIKSDL